VSRLRKELTYDELTFENGSLQPPSKPGLGVELNHDALEQFAASAALVSA